MSFVKQFDLKDRQLTVRKIDEYLNYNYQIPKISFTLDFKHTLKRIEVVKFSVWMERFELSLDTPISLERKIRSNDSIEYL